MFQFDSIVSICLKSSLSYGKIGNPVRNCHKTVSHPPGDLEEAPCLVVGNFSFYLSGCGEAWDFPP